jgi:hypothetical protein
MINGMPQPALVAFLADKAPHFIHLGFTRSCHIHRHLVWVQRAQQI